MGLCNVQFKFITSDNEYIKTMLYIIPQTVPMTEDGSIVVGNGLSLACGGANKNPIVELFPALYTIRVAGYNFNTEFDINLTTAPTGSTIQASAYIV